jgi:shikimate 5-dehydrogenase
VRQSKGVCFHNRSFGASDTNAVYVNFLARDLRSFFAATSGFISGLSVTMPFKHEAVRYLDALGDDVSRRLRVVNTVVKRGADLVGYNTDYLAVLHLLRRTGIRKKAVLVLGSGATAAVMALAAAELGGDVTISARSDGKARRLAKQLGCSFTPFHKRSRLTPALVLNGTPVGMAGDAVRILPRSFFRKGMTLFDAVMHPTATPLVRDALSRGSRVITGTRFFEQQAAMQSKIFLKSLS